MSVAHEAARAADRVTRSRPGMESRPEQRTSPRDSHGDPSLSSTLPTAGRALRYSVRRAATVPSTRARHPNAAGPGDPPTFIRSPRFEWLEKERGTGYPGLAEMRSFAAVAIFDLTL